MGNNPLHQKISEDVKEIFDAAKEIWKAEQLSGPNLLDFIEQQAKARGWILGPSYVQGHRLSTFPHNLITKESLASANFSPSANVWVLEVQIRHPSEYFGAFYEDLLL